jgi:diacylglycerol kinase (ATP)
MTPTGGALIVNPVAGADQGEQWLPDLETRLRSISGTLSVAVTEGPGDAERAARQAAEAGCAHVFVAGGDGTLNEVVNGLTAVDRGSSPPVIGLVPLGTGNDFAAALGIPTDVNEALEVLQARRAVAVDLCRMNDRRFVNVSAGGFIGEVSERTTDRLKTVAGRLAYLVAGAQAILEGEPFTVDLDFAGDARDLTDDRKPVSHLRLELLTFAVCNAQLIGGGKPVGPYAAFDDGLLDVCLVEAMPIVEFLGVLRQVTDGRHVEDERVHYIRTSAMTLASDRSIKVNTDGEVVEATSCQYSLRPGALHFFAGEREISTT